MQIKIRTKFVLTLVTVAITAAVPLSLYILAKQEKDKIEATISVGKGNTRLLALSMLDVFLKSGGQLASMRIDAIEAINVFRDQQDIGVVFAQTIMVNQKNYGAIMATLDITGSRKSESQEKEDNENSEKKLTQTEVEPLWQFQEKHEGACLNNPQQACYNFAYVATYEKIPVVLSVMSISEEHVLAPIRALRQLIYISATVAVILSALIGFGASQFITRPISALVHAVKLYSSGERNTRVQIKVRDELRTLGDAFNEMAEEINRQIREIEDHRDNLELKVQERTRQLQEALESVERLKEQQDADYFLTTFLYKPLCINKNNSNYIQTEFFVKQKKEFVFRNKIHEIGGDICITANLLFLEDGQINRYIFATNADAMGKSLQGVGGAIVFGTALNTILASSTAGNRALETHPRIWLTRIWRELHQIFLSFNGSMMVSAAFALINEHNGNMYYLNAEHPWSVLYRDKLADFIEDQLTLRKLGAEMPLPDLPPIRELQLNIGDTLFMGSDGRDDLDLRQEVAEDTEREINEDERLFLQHVTKADGDLGKTVNYIKDTGHITDDLSLLKIYVQGYNPEHPQSGALRKIGMQALYQKLRLIRDKLRKKELPAAEAELTNLAKFQNITENENYQYFMGLLKVYQQKYKEALEHFRYAHNLGMENASLLTNLGNLLARENRKDEAKLYWEKALKLRPNNVYLRKKLEELS